MPDQNRDRNQDQLLSLVNSRFDDMARRIQVTDDAILDVAGQQRITSDAVQAFRDELREYTVTSLAMAAEQQKSVTAVSTTVRAYQEECEVKHVSVQDRIDTLGAVAYAGKNGVDRIRSVGLTVSKVLTLVAALAGAVAAAILR